MVVTLGSSSQNLPFVTRRMVAGKPTSGQSVLTADRIELAMASEDASLVFMRAFLLAQRSEAPRNSHRASFGGPGRGYAPCGRIQHPARATISPRSTPGPPAFAWSSGRPKAAGRYLSCFFEGLAECSSRRPASGCDVISPPGYGPGKRKRGYRKVPSSPAASLPKGPFMRKLGRITT